MRFVLASASPARLGTLQAAGVAPEVIVSGIDESGVSAVDTASLVQQLAQLKATAVSAGITGPALVLGCDSLLELDGESLGKPDSTDTARVRWQRMRGQSGILHTGHCLIDTAADQAAIAVTSTIVTFGDATNAEIEAYLRTGEPQTVAGAFTIDGLGGWFVEGVHGDHHGVVGLSLPGLRRLLHELGYSLSDIGYPVGVPADSVRHDSVPLVP